MHLSAPCSAELAGGVTLIEQPSRVSGSDPHLCTEETKLARSMPFVKDVPLELKYTVNVSPDRERTLISKGKIKIREARRFFSIWIATIGVCIASFAFHQGRLETHRADCVTSLHCLFHAAEIALRRFELGVERSRYRGLRVVSRVAPLYRRPSLIPGNNSRICDGSSMTAVGSQFGEGCFFPPCSFAINDSRECRAKKPKAIPRERERRYSRAHYTFPPKRASRFRSRSAWIRRPRYPAFSKGLLLSPPTGYTVMKRASAIPLVLTEIPLVISLRSHVHVARGALNTRPLPLCGSAIVY